MSESVDVAEGSVDFRPVTRLLRRNWRRAYEWARRSPLAAAAVGPRSSPSQHGPVEGLSLMTVAAVDQRDAGCGEHADAASDRGVLSRMFGGGHAATIATGRSFLWCRRLACRGYVQARRLHHNGESINLY